jgi:peptidoglycan/LPS O-acetylase OafA/YrhL
MHIRVSSSESSKVIHQLNGLRGVAAFIVVVSHIVAAFFPAYFFGANTNTGALSNSEFIFSQTPLFILINGSFAVYVFFVLSGYVLSASMDKSRTSILRLIIARYIRLTVPCAFSLVFAMVLIATGAMVLPIAANYIDYTWIKGLYVLQDINWKQAVFVTLGGFYIYPETPLNPVIWTMQREFLGSVMIYSVCRFHDKSFVRIVLYFFIFCLLVVLKWEPHLYFCFLLGGVMWELRIRERSFSTLIIMAALAIGIIFGGKSFGEPALGSIYVELLQYVRSFHPHAGAFIWSIGASALVFSLITSRVVSYLFTTNAAIFLGRISFSLYLLHIPLLGSFLAGLFLLIGRTSQGLMVISVVLYLVILIVASSLFERIIDRAAIRLSRVVKEPGSGVGILPRIRSAIWKL